MTWEKQVPHHKWADELAEEKRVKEVKRDAKKAAKAEDHSKECPYCHHEPVVKFEHPDPANPGDDDQYKDQYECPACFRVYRVNCPGTILLNGDTTMVEYSGQNKTERLWNKDG